MIVANLLAARVTLFYGPSGVGKSSVLNAGAIPRLRALAEELRTETGRPQHVVVRFSSWRDDPEPALASAIGDAVSQAIESEPLRDGSLTGVLHRCAESYDGDVLVILDQFEEFFVYHPNEAANGGFPATLARALADRDIRANFLISLREDALGRLQVFEGLVPGLFENPMPLERLSRDAGRAAIVKPLERFNEAAEVSERVSIEPALVEAVLDQVTAGRFVTGQGGRRRRDPRR